MWLEIKTDLMWWWVVGGGWWVVGVEGENRNKLGACQLNLVKSLTVSASEAGQHTSCF